MKMNSNLKNLKPKTLRLKPWTIALLILIIVDALVTIHIGTETNPLITGTMKLLGLSLFQAMIIKIFYSLPFVYILNRTDWSKFTFFAYLGLYGVLVGFQF
jgi:hypothetical protein